jgi:hypothetical protein
MKEVSLDFLLTENDSILKNFRRLYPRCLFHDMTKPWSLHTFNPCNHSSMKMLPFRAMIILLIRFTEAMQTTSSSLHVQQLRVHQTSKFGVKKRSLLTSEKKAGSDRKSINQFHGSCLFLSYRISTTGFFKFSHTHISFRS